MFDSRHDLEPLLKSEQASVLVKVHPKTLQRYAHAGLVVGLRVGKLRRFRASDLEHCLPNAVNSEQLSVLSHHP
jgi:predicted site-specific integrase-resolvase